MTTSLTVSDIPVDQAGAIISQSVEAGVNGIESVDYFSSNYDAAYQEALEKAVAAAQTKAETIARQEEEPYLVFFTLRNRATILLPGIPIPIH